MIAGNKTDVTEKREVPQEEASLVAQQAGAKHIEVSAKTGNRIKDLFLELARDLPGMKAAEEAKPETLTLAAVPPKSKEKCAC
jgi:GTPase SAR1 family protein